MLRPTTLTAVQSLLFYMAIVAIALVIHACVTLPLLLRLVGGVSPLDNARYRVMRFGRECFDSAHSALLVESNVITEAQLQSALADQKKTGLKLGRQLIEAGYVDEDRFLAFLSQQLDIPLVDQVTGLDGARIRAAWFNAGTTVRIEGPGIEGEIVAAE